MMKFEMVKTEIIKFEMIKLKLTKSEMYFKPGSGNGNVGSNEIENGKIGNVKS